MGLNQIWTVAFNDVLACETTGGITLMTIGLWSDGIAWYELNSLGCTPTSVNADQHLEGTDVRLYAYLSGSRLK